MKQRMVATKTTRVPPGRVRFSSEFSRLTWSEKRGDTYLRVVEFPILHLTDIASVVIGNFVVAAESRSVNSGISMNMIQRYRMSFASGVLAAASGLAFLLRLIRSAMVWIMPAMVIASLLIFSANLLNFLQFQDERLIRSLLDLHAGFIALLPFMLSVALGSMLALQMQLPRPQVAVLCMVSLFAVQVLLKDRYDTVQTYSFLLGIVTPLITVPFIKCAFARRIGRLVSQTLTGNNIRDSLNLIVPGLIGIIAAMLLLSAANALWQYVPVPSIALNPVERPYITGSVVALLNSLSWFLGIHGYYASLPVLVQLMRPEWMQPDVIGLAFMETFVFVGGSGATAGFVIAILLRSSNRMHRRIAWISLPLSFFGINEVILFCLPIILNLRLFVPFLLAPLVLTLFSTALLDAGAVSFNAQLSLPNAPVLINAWLVSGGQASSLLVQLLCVTISTLIYLPFVKRIAQRSEPHEIELTQLNATFISNADQGIGLEDDPVERVKQAGEQARQLEQKFAHIKDLTFELHYQPKVDPQRNVVIGAEALIRAREPSGKLVFPDAFLPSFGEARLSCHLDLWVAQQVASQLAQWIRAGVTACPISLNVSAETLADPDTSMALSEVLAPWADRVRVELTEETMASQDPAIDAAIARLKSIGIPLDIDDFGTGYSSLSYLNRFAPNAIKIDRSFVLQIDNPQGAALFHSLIKFAHSLGLEVVVEGVDSAAQLAHLAQYQNVSVQGWFYAKAMTPDALLDFVAQRNGGTTTH